MRFYRLALLGVSVLVFALLVSPARCADKGSHSSATLANLMTAFQDESIDHANYVAYATKADEEGYSQVASMFRAIARAEEIHAANHEALIRKLGGEPKAEVPPVNVRSTQENLAAAIVNETEQKDIMYPRFIQQAKKDRNDAAANSFRYARSAETEHFAYYEQAVNNLDDYRGKNNVTFLICPICGKTVRALPNDKCPMCSTDREKFEKVR